MERLRQALDRAKQERDASGAQSDPVLSANRRPTGENTADIVYSQTRTVALRSDVLRERRVVVDEPSASGDAYRMLRTQVLQRMQAEGWKTLAITSPRASEGKTLTAINLAIGLGVVDRTALLVDADLRRSGVQSILDLPPGPGLGDHLATDVPIEKCFLHPGIDRLVVLPAGGPRMDSFQLLASRKMANLVEELGVRYTSRYVIFDLPPLLESADATAFVPLVDAVLLVVEESRTRRDDVQRARQLLRTANLLGFVLNKAKSRGRRGYYA